jgi:hypothetical protein
VIKKLKEVDLGNAKKTFDDMTKNMGDGKKHVDNLFKLFQ